MNHARYRQFILASVLIPPLALVVAVLVFWPDLMTSEDAIVFAFMCVISGTGITVGFHRLLTHRSFRTYRPVRLAFAVFGTLAAEGPVIIWVAHHRHHHAMPDQPGDPHSPQMFGTGARAALKGLWHAHMGWLLDDNLSSQPLRYAPDLAREPEMRWISKHFLAIVIGGILFAGGLDAVISGSPAGLVRGIVWGGLVRIAFVNHTTYSVNSICHYFGRRRFETEDDSRNVAWLAPFTFGEAWHNNHHAFPTSARHGLRWYELDPSALVIRALELTGLAWDVVRVPESRLATKTIAGENR